MRALAAALALAATAFTAGAAHARPVQPTCDALGAPCPAPTPDCSSLEPLGVPADCYSGGFSDVCVGMDSRDAPLACAPAGDEANIAVHDMAQALLGGGPTHGG